MKQVFEVSRDDLRQALREELSSLIAESYLARYENTIVPVSVATHILGISKRTLYRYVASKKLKCLPHSTGEDYHFNLRQLLEFSINKQ